jgi:hypothetical protein
MNMKITNVEDHPRLSRLVEHAWRGFMDNAVEIRRGGAPVAYLMDTQAADLAFRLAARYIRREPPFTQKTLGRWLERVVKDMKDADVTALLGNRSCMHMKAAAEITDRPRLSRLIEHVQRGFMDNVVEIRRGGEPVAYLMDPLAADLAFRLAARYIRRDPPFTQKNLDRWIEHGLGRFAHMPQNEVVKTLYPDLEHAAGVTLLRKDLAAGAPANADGTINIVHFAAWLLSLEKRGR